MVDDDVEAAGLQALYTALLRTAGSVGP